MRTFSWISQSFANEKRRLRTKFQKRICLPLLLNITNDFSRNLNCLQLALGNPSLGMETVWVPVWPLEKPKSFEAAS